MTATWPADSIQRRAVASLVPYARNARTHSSEQVDQIAASIREWGWTMPILIDETGTILAGHGRILAAKQLGLLDVPVIEARGWSDVQKRAYILADNKLALNAGWDQELLKLELNDLSGLDFDMSLMGFGDLELGRLLGTRAGGLTDEDEAPELPAQAVSELGDIWILGSHRLACGDSTDPLTVERLLQSVRPHLMVTDPPYGVDYDPDWRNKALRTDGSAIAGRAIGQVANDHRADWGEAWALFPGDVAYVWHGGMHAAPVADSLVAAGFKLRAQIIWAKSNFAIGRGDYHWQHEPCWYASRGRGHWTGDRQQSTVWQIDKPAKSETGHSTQKPVECMRRPIENNSSAGQAVYEPFCGSGTTIIAGEQTGRAVYAIEINPAYVDVAVTRWRNFTGLRPTLQQTGQSFVEVMAERCPNQAVSIVKSDGSASSGTKRSKPASAKAGASSTALPGAATDTGPS